MFRQYADEQVIRGLMRFYSDSKHNREKGLKGLDIGTGAGRHAKALCDFGFDVTAIDLLQENILDAKKVCEGYNIRFIESDFDNFYPTYNFDLVIAWEFLYAYNYSVQTVLDRLEHINSFLNEEGRILISLKTNDDSFKELGVLNEHGTVDNPIYNVPGYVFFTRSEMIDMLNSTGYVLDYFEVFSRYHNLKWRDNTSNEMWLNSELPIREDYYAICARKA